MNIIDCKKCGNAGHVFCWNDLSYNGPATYAIHCRQCDNRGPIKPTEAEAITAWNNQQATLSPPPTADNLLPLKKQCLASVTLLYITVDERVAKTVEDSVRAYTQALEGEVERLAIAINIDKLRQESTGCPAHYKPLLEAAANLCEKVGAFLFHYTEGAAQDMAKARLVYDDARKAVQEEPRQ